MLTLALLAGCTAPPAEHISLSWTEDTPDTWMTSDMLKNGQARFTLGSRSRVGRGSGIIQSQRLPGRIFFALRAHSPASIRLSYGTVQIIAAIERPAPHAIHEWVVLPGDAASQGRLIDSASPYWVPIRFVIEPGQSAEYPIFYGYVELDVPPDGYASQQHTFTVEWQDGE